VWQSRLFGPVYQGMYVAQSIGGGLFGLGYGAVTGSNVWDSMMTAGYMDNPFEHHAYERQGYWPPTGRAASDLVMWK
jgi:hypothetical protein